MTATYRAPPAASLAAIEAFLVENLEAYHFPRTAISTELALALVRYALRHGAVVAGDLADKPP